MNIIRLKLMKKMTMLREWMLFAILLISQMGYAQSSEVDGINYELYDAGVRVVAKEGKYSGEITIPEMVEISFNSRSPEPLAVIAVADEAFKDCSELTSVVFPPGIWAMGKSVFSGCTNLKSVALPASIKAIADNAFTNCRSLEELVIPKNVKSIGSDAFYNCGIRTLVLHGVLSSYKTYKSGRIGTFSVFEGLSANNTTIYVHSTEIENVKAVFEGKIFSLDIPYNVYVDPSDVYLKGFYLRLKANEYANEAGESTLVGINVGDNNYEVNDGFIDEKYCRAYGLQFDKEYIIRLVLTENDEERIVDSNLKLRTKRPELYITDPTSDTKLYTTDQTSIHFKKIRYNFENDPSVNITEIGVSVNGVDYAREEGKTVIDVTGLFPNHKYAVTPYVIHDGVERITGQYNNYVVSTKALSPIISDIELSPTTVKALGTHTDGDAVVSESFFSIGWNDEIHSDILKLISLEPQTSKTLRYTVKMESGYSETCEKEIVTPAVEFNTLAPKVSNKGEAIVAATTNLADIETNAGFEWRKVDAPEVVPSKSATAAIYEGTMEGLIKNLDVASYYQVRPYYESVAGNKYYGEWIGFDPSDFSYFEPTVHTYAEVEVSEGTAVLTGYALAGTDEVLEQGFEYWIATGNNSSRRRAPLNVQTVIATGQRMIATLTGLQDNATYYYRAYVKTAKGTTYGEEHSFLTPVAAGIESIAPSSLARMVIGYYNLQGKKLDEPQKGMMIVRYSDGTTRKIVSR